MYYIEFLQNEKFLRKCTVSIVFEDSSSIESLGSIVVNNLMWRTCGKKKCPEIVAKFKGYLAIDVSLNDDNLKLKISKVPDILILNSNFIFCFLVNKSHGHFTVIYKSKDGQYFHYDDAPKSVKKCRKDLLVSPQFILYRQKNKLFVS